MFGAGGTPSRLLHRLRVDSGQFLRNESRKPEFYFRANIVPFGPQGTERKRLSNGKFLEPGFPEGRLLSVLQFRACGGFAGVEKHSRYEAFTRRTGAPRPLPLLCSSLQLPATVLSSACLARPPVALTWAPQGALPAKQWRPGRRDPPSGRGRMPAVEQGAQDVRPQRALGGCGDSTQRTHQGSKWALFQYW